MDWYRRLSKGPRGPNRKKVDIQLERPTFWLLPGFDDHQVEKCVTPMTVDTREGMIDSYGLAQPVGNVIWLVDPFIGHPDRS